MALRATNPTLVTSWKTALTYLPKKYKLDHSADQYGVQHNFPPTDYSHTTDTNTPTRGLTPPTEEKLYHPIHEPYLVPPKYRQLYNFNIGHGKYLYSKDPLWVEARERHWDDMQTAAQVHRKNFEHLRRIYRRQWQDAHRYNLDEYLTTLNRVKKQEEIEREVSEEQRQKGWEEDLARIDAITLLQEKRRNLTSENFWRLNIWKYERAMESLMYLTQTKVNNEFLTPENLESSLEQECSKWIGKRSLLNMFGRIPYTDDEDGVPELEIQYTFMNEGMEDDGREAFKRLTELAERGEGRSKFTKREATYAELDFGDDDLGDSGLEDTGGDPSENADVEEDDPRK